MQPRAMSAEQLQAFWEAVDGDTSLQKKLSSSIDGEIDTPIEAAAVVAIATEAGFSITAGDLLKADAQAMKADAEALLELSDVDLERVAGGTLRIPGTAGQTPGSIIRNGCYGGKYIDGGKNVLGPSGNVYTAEAWKNVCTYRDNQSKLGKR